MQPMVGKGFRRARKARITGKRFTRAAGLAAIHPVAEALKDEYFYLAWQLRHEAFLRFGYDPDAVFSVQIDKYGFKK